MASTGMMDTPTEVPDGEGCPGWCSYHGWDGPAKEYHVSAAGVAVDGPSGHVRVVLQQPVGSREPTVVLDVMDRRAGKHTCFDLRAREAALTAQLLGQASAGIVVADV